MKTIYLNTRTGNEIETVDEFTRNQGQSPRDFRKYVNDMVKNYHLAGIQVYKSSRACRDWMDIKN